MKDSTRHYQWRKVPKSKPKNMLILVCQGFWQGCQDYTVGKGKSLQKMGKVDIHMQKNEVGPVPYTTYKNELKMNHKPKGKT